ncbi:hypothetical protein HY839_03870 [Candidatus Azambacteria bacterium]|nr:hypothetical protein [Candidatus Azambacteria bacterium]
MNRIKHQFKLLRSIAPDASRTANFRRILESKVALESSALPARSVCAFLGRGMRTVPALALALIITLVGSGSGVSFAAQNAIPGETLYRVKLATEQVRIAVTPGKKAKAELHLGFASRRLQEIEQLIEQNGGSRTAVSEALTRYEDELDESEALVIHNPSLAQDIAPIIGETTESHKRTLKRVAEKAHERSFNGGLDDELDDAYEHAESKDDAVLYAALAATSTPPAMIPPVIKEKSRKKWESLEREMKKMEAARAVPVASENNAVIATGTADAFTAAQTRVGEARTRWENGEYRAALEHSIEARELMKEAEKMEKEKKKEREREQNKQKEESRNEDEDKKDD